MKKVLIKVTATIFIFLISGIMSNLYSENWIDKVVVDKKIEINKNAKLIIDHEFGNVKCKNWDQDAISVKVTVSVQSNDEEKAMKIIDNVFVDVSGNKNEVIAICDLNQKNNNNKKSKVKIDFEIFMPESISLEMEHKFGTAYIESVSGPSSISSEYSSLNVVSLSNIENKIEVSFGEANIENIKNGEIEISYSQFNLSSADFLSIESEYSDVKIGDAKKVSLELEGGNANFGKVGILEAESSFSNLDVGFLAQSVEVETSYGSLTIKDVDKDFSNIEIVNEFGSVSINIDESAIYELVAEGEFCNIEFPEDRADISYRKKSQLSTLIKGVVGNGTTPTSKLSVVSEYGSVNIK